MVLKKERIYITFVLFYRWGFLNLAPLSKEILKKTGQHLTKTALLLAILMRRIKSTTRKLSQPRKHSREDVQPNEPRRRQRHLDRNMGQQMTAHVKTTSQRVRRRCVTACAAYYFPNPSMGLACEPAVISAFQNVLRSRPLLSPQNH